MTNRPAWWVDHRDCPQKREDPPAECYCPKCPVCQHRPEMKDPVRGCRVITELRHKVYEDNVVCGCRETTHA